MRMRVVPCDDKEHGNKPLAHTNPHLEGIAPNYLEPAPLVQVERHQAFGRGAVRAARIIKLLQDPSWNWGGLVTFYIVVAVLVVVVLYVPHGTGIVPVISGGWRWATATLVPTVLTLLKLLLQVQQCRSSGRGGMRHTWPFRLSLDQCHPCLLVRPAIALLRAS